MEKKMYLTRAKKNNVLERVDVPSPWMNTPRIPVHFFHYNPLLEDLKDIIANRSESSW
jgi:hypothetical protein